MWEYNHSDEFYHHGVKGMRWGVRRFRRKDGTLTPAGKKRYSDVSGVKRKSKHRQQLEEQYKKMGLTDEQAQTAASKRIRTERILAASATMTVAACVAYAMNKRRKRKIDGVIKAGEMLQRIEKVDTDGKLHGMFYASKGNHDNKRYEGMLGMARKKQTGHAYLMKLEATSNIKVASRDKAAKIFGDLYKNDPDFRRDVERHVKPGLFSRGNTIKNVNDLSNRNIKKMYENFNSNLIGVRYDESGADKKFYNKLKSAGYGAIQDINDMKFSGYNAKNPLIVFDNSNDNIMVKSVSEITGNLKRDARIESRKAAGEIFAKQFIETAGVTSAAGITVAAVETYRSTPNNPYETQKR